MSANSSRLYRLCQNRIPSRRLRSRILDSNDVSGTLDISAATLDIDEIGSGATEAVYIFATYGSLTGTFATVQDLPTDYDIDYAYDDGVDTNNIALVYSPAAYVVSAISGDTTEAGVTATFTMRLDSQPDGNVVIDVASSDTGEGTVSLSTLTFTDLNWNADQPVTVTGVDDAMADGSQTYAILLTVNAVGTVDTTGYAALDPDDVTVINIDNDSAGFTVSAASADTISGNTAENGATATFAIRLNSEPNGDVNLAVASLDTTEGKALPVTLAFDAADWNADKTVTVTGVDDNMADGNQTFTISVSNAGTSDTTGYAGLDPDDVTVVNTDDESSGFLVGAISGNTGEDGTSAQFTVRLTSAPNGAVTVNVESSDTTEGTASPASLVFTDLDWSSEKSVTVTGVDDGTYDGNQTYAIRLTVDTANTSDTTGYAAGDPDDVWVVNVDDETPGFTVSAGSGTTDEDGTEAAFTITLNTQPDGDVVIDVESSDTTEGTVFPSSITFSDLDWNAEKAITVRGADDAVADGNQAYTIRLTVNTAATTDSTGYASLDPDDIALVNTDNESAGFAVSAISGNTGEDGTSATFTVRLTSAPNGDVAVDAVGSDASEGTASPATLVFDADDWNADQTVTVTGVDDNLADGGQGYRIILSVNAGGTADTTGYAGLDPDDVTVTKKLKNNP